MMAEKQIYSTITCVGWGSYYLLLSSFGNKSNHNRSACVIFAGYKSLWNNNSMQLTARVQSFYYWDYFWNNVKHWNEL